MTNNIDTTAAEIATICNAPVANNVEVTEWSYITGWISTEEANDWMQRLITEGKYNKKQLKKSSPRFANGKDKSEGYQVRVIAVSGIQPSVELAVVGYRKNMEKKPKLDTTLLHAFKNMLKLDNIARNEDGQLKITDKCVWLADGSRIQLVVKK